MAANDIPNLKTLLASRRGGPSRGRGRGRGGPGAPSEATEVVRDNAVRNTDQDAAGSRVSCVESGYLDDPYAALFATQPSTRRLPLLNRGTYVRTSAIDLLVDRFLTTSPSTPKQIVSLGAGTDTRFFRLKDKYPSTNLVYHEIDFHPNTTDKLSSIRRHPQLYTKLSPAIPIRENAPSYHSPTFNIHPMDLRHLASRSSDIPPPLPNLNPSTPTLLLSEMCLVYLPSRDVSAIIATFLSDYLRPSTPASLVLYEPILPHDAFGRTMISNLSTRNIFLPTLTAYPELGDQRARLRGYGFVGGARAADTEVVWREWVSGAEKERVAGLEMLDEMEELELLLRHYCVAWGWRDGEVDGGDVFGRAWADIKEQK
ncbi:leucine carboxyl methyltransferase [Corynespora cassiicola Philippines]|uniref:Leucine carboxyl methyltransferase 1 n=1 Tax=Corynespora cassiicola Philippines TaxID=1448308 RepID=A0A2T2NH68_CORCC|nr:leucine carboxyl methyltransferase [Corynespora cassiicola Philippines]